MDRKKIWSILKVMKMIKKMIKKIKSAFVKTSADKWGEKQMKEMAKLRGKLILM